MVENNKKAKVYISYAGGDVDSNDPVVREREEIVNLIEKELKKYFFVERDKSTLDHMKSIPDFMKEIGEGEYVVVVISKKYLTESGYTLKEIREIVRNGRLRKRVYIVMTRNAPNIFDDGIVKQTILTEANNKIDEIIENIVEEIEGREEERIFNECRNEIGRFLKSIKELKSFGYTDDEIKKLADRILKDYKEHNKFIYRYVKEIIAFFVLLLFFLSAILANVYFDFGKSDLEILINKANEGDVQAQYSLGVYYHDGNNTIRDFNKSYKYFNKAVKQGNIQAKIYLGKQYEVGEGVEKNPLRALGYYSEACKAGLMEGCYKQGRMLVFPCRTNVMSDEKEAFRLYQEACKNGYVRACAAIGVMYEKGKGVDKNITKAVELYKDSCIKGSMLGCSNLGYSYKNGTGVEKNLNKAIHYFSLACNHGETRGCTGLAFIHRDNENDKFNNQQTALKMFKESCKNGDSRGCSGYGYMLDKGLGVDKNLTKAAKYYKKGCDGCSMWGCNNLAMLYASGAGVEKDIKHALSLYKKACNNNYAFACKQFGFIYKNGKVAKQDYEKAIKFLTQACDGENQEACVGLGDMHVKGLSVEKDYSRALRLFEKACSDDNMWGCNYLGWMHEKAKGTDKNNTVAIKFYKKACMGGNYSACKNVGEIYKKEKQYSKAIKHYDEIIGIYKKKGYLPTVAKLYYDKYDIYWHMGKKYKENAKQALLDSIKWYKKANKEEKTDKYTINIANNTCDLAWFYQHKDINNTDAIVDNYTTCIEMKKKLDPQKHLIDVVWSQRALADYYFSQQEYEKAEKVYKEALRNIEKVVNEYNQTQYVKELAWTYHDIGASMDGHTEEFEGLPYFEKALQTYEKYEIFDNNYVLTLNALQYIYSEKTSSKELERIAKKLLKYYEKKEDNITWNKAFQYYILGSSKRIQRKEDALYYLDKSLEMFEQIKSQNKFYASYIPSIIMEKVWYFLDKGDTKKAKKIFEKLKTYNLHEDSKIHAKLLKLQLHKNFDKDKLKQIFSALSLKSMGYIVDLTFRAEEYIKKNELKKGKNLYLQAYRVALNAFNKQTNIYRSTLTQIVLNLATFDNSDNEDDILKQTIDVMHLHHYDQTLDMALLKYTKAKNKILRSSIDDESVTLLNDAIKIFEKEKKRKLVCESKYYIAAYYELSALVDKAGLMYKEALQCAKTEKNDNLIATINRNLSRIYQKKGLYIVAIDFVLENISILEKYKKSLDLEDYRYQLTGLYNELLPLYIKAFDMDGFYKSYGELNKISKEVIKKWPEELTMRIENLVKIFQESDQPKEAVKFLEYALKTHDAELEDEDKGIYLAILGDLYEAVGNIDRSKEAYRKAIEVYRKANQSDMDEINQRLIARTEEELKRCIKINEACHRKKYVICTITDENNNTTDEVVLENECEEGWVEESNIEGQTCSGNDIPQAGEVWLISPNECPQKIIMANEDEFERYGIEANESVLIDAVEPVR